MGLVLEGCYSYQYAILQGVAYVVTVGAGGAGGYGSNGSQGVASSWNSTALGGGATISTVGGGYGAISYNNGGSGGSGGSGGGSAGSGTSGQGNNSGPSSYNVPSGGGGGAGTIGCISSIAASFGYSACYPGANGGSGMYCFDGNIYAGGGASGMWGVPTTSTSSLYPVPTGGLGGGGNSNIGGGYSTTAILPGFPGAQGTGGGGGGSGGFWNSANNRIQNGGSGGSGIVIVRTLATQKVAASTTGNPSIYVSGNYRYYKFLANGSITF